MSEDRISLWRGPALNEHDASELQARWVQALVSLD